MKISFSVPSEPNTYLNLCFVAIFKQNVRCSLFTEISKALPANVCKELQKFQTSTVDVQSIFCTKRWTANKTRGAPLLLKNFSCCSYLRVLSWDSHEDEDWIIKFISLAVLESEILSSYFFWTSSAKSPQNLNSISPSALSVLIINAYFVDVRNYFSIKSCHVLSVSRKLEQFIAAQLGSTARKLFLPTVLQW